MADRVNAMRQRPRWTLRKHVAAVCLSAICGSVLPVSVEADPIEIIARVKESVVAIGTFERTRSPQFQFLGTGFAVNDGTVIVTNAHVVSQPRDTAHMESLVIVTGLPEKDKGDQIRVREAKELVVDTDVDIAVLRVPGPALPTLKIKPSDSIREGQSVLFTGFPIGTVLGLFPATSRGMVSAITPIAIPQAKAGQLDALTIKRAPEQRSVSGVPARRHGVSGQQR